MEKDAPEKHEGPGGRCKHWLGSESTDSHRSLSANVALTTGHAAQQQTAARSRAALYAITQVQRLGCAEMSSSLVISGTLYPLRNTSFRMRTRASCRAEAQLHRHEAAGPLSMGGVASVHTQELLRTCVQSCATQRTNDEKGQAFIL